MGLTMMVAAHANSQGKRVALLNTKPTQPYMAAWNKGFMKAASAAGMAVTHLTTINDAALQAQQIDDSIAQKVDAIVLGNIDHRATVPALVRAKAAGIPVVLVVDPMDREYDNLYVSYIGTDQEKLGRLAGESMLKGLTLAGKKQAQVVVVTGTPTQLNTRRRLEGFKAALAANPAVKVVAEEDGRWMTPPSEKVTSDLLVRFGGKIDGVFAMADNQATGSIQAIEAAGLKLGAKGGGIVVVASNCMKDGIQHIREGKQYSTNTQIPTVEGKYAAEQVAAMFGGAKLPKIDLVPVEAITADTVDKYAAGCSY
jgi:ABC-type sugar transport system substrate-binding protein